MKLTKVVFSILAFSLTSCGGGLSSVKNSTPQEAIETLFMAIKNNDQETFQHLVVKKEDVESWAKTAANPATVVSEALEVLKPDSIMIKEFHEIRSAGDADGIKDWGELVFKRATYEDANKGNLQTVRYAKAEFTYGDYIGGIRLGTLIKSNRGWVLEPSYNAQFLKMMPLKFVR